MILAVYGGMIGWHGDGQIHGKKDRKQEEKVYVGFDLIRCKIT
jgi:hypothetical protein